MLPLLHKIKNKVLNLTNYSISPTVLKSFVSALKPQESIFSRVILENNGLNDNDMELLVSSLQLMNELKSIICIRNEFSLGSVKALAPLL